MCAFGAVRHFGQNTGGGEDCKKNWDFSLRLLLSPGTHTPNQPSKGDFHPISDFEGTFHLLQRETSRSIPY